MIRYPPEWSKVKYPAARDRLFGLLDEIAHDPASGLNWPPAERQDVWWALDEMLNVEGVLDRAAAERLGEQLIDDAEAEALERLAVAMRKLIQDGPRRPLDFGTVPPFDHIPQTEEAYRHPAWTEVAHCAQALFALITRWGTPKYPPAD